MADFGNIKPFRAKVGLGGSFGSGPLSSSAQFTQQVNAQFDAILDNYKGFVESVVSQGAEVVMAALQPTFDESQEIVPVKTGALKESGYLESVGSQVEIGYGRGGDPEYAPIVHEDLEAHHAPPTQAKFLQQPLEQNEAQIQNDIATGFGIAAGLSSAGRFGG